MRCSGRFHKACAIAITFGAVGSLGSIRLRGTSWHNAEMLNPGADPRQIAARREGKIPLTSPGILRAQAMDDQRWPPGACVVFTCAASLALWTIVILALSATLG